MRFNSVGAPLVIDIDGGKTITLRKLTVRDWLEAQDVAVECERRRLMAELDAAGMTEPQERIEAMRAAVLSNGATGIAVLWMNQSAGQRWVIERACSKSEVSADWIDRTTMSPGDIARLVFMLIGLQPVDEADPRNPAETPEQERSTGFTPPA